MLRERVQSKRLALPWLHLTERGKDVEAKEILKVLRQAATDDRFIARLTEQGNKALKGYALSQRARAALLSGDIRWIEARVGRLNARLRTWLDCRLEQEIW
jgi:hypothetical protein